MALNLNGPSGNIISADEAGNSTKVLLSPAGTFTGNWESVVDYTTAAVAIKGDNATDGTLYIESSQDGGVVVNSVPFTVSDASFDLPHIWNVVETHIRVRYVNGSTAQTGSFQLQTKYSNGQELGLLQNAGDTITSDTDVQNVRAIGTGTDPNGVYKNQVVSGENAANSTTVTLGAGDTFIGDWAPLAGYHGITVLVDGTSAGTADGTLYREFSHDGVTVHRSISVAVDDVTSAAPRTLGTVADFFRVRYVNGSTATTSFDIETMFHTAQVNLVSRLDQTLSGNDDVTNIRSVTMGRKPDGTYRNSQHNGIAFTTSSTLGSGGVFLSDWIDTDDYNATELFVKADVVSANHGLEIEYTDDLLAPTVQETLKYTFTDIDVARGYLEIHREPRLVGFRVRYTNGTSAQGSFLLQSDLKTNGSTDLYNPGGALVTADFKTEVALGNVPNYQEDEAFGLVRFIDGADVETTVWAYGTDTFPSKEARKTFKTTAAAIWVASSNAGDTADVTLTYNDSSNLLQKTTVTLNGQTPVDTGVVGLDCNYALVTSADDDLAGNVYIQQGNAFTAGIPDTPGDVLAVLPAGVNVTQQATLRVPSDSTMTITNVYIHAVRANGSAGSVDVNLRIKPPGGSWFVKRPYITETRVDINKQEEIVLEAGSLVEVAVDGVSDSDTSVNCGLAYFLVANQ